MIKDLDMHVTSSQDPGVHIVRTCVKANSALGLIARATQNSFSIYIEGSLDDVLVRSNLEYGSVVGSTSGRPLQSLNTVQTRFLPLMVVSTPPHPTNPPIHPYT